REEKPYCTAEINDWKTTSSISDWAKDEQGLIDTIQMPLYAKATIWDWPDIEFVRISHGYFGTYKREAKKVSILLDRDIIERRGEYISNTVRKMIQVAKETDPDKVEYNLKACPEYKGCPYASICVRA